MPLVQSDGLPGTAVEAAAAERRVGSPGLELNSSVRASDHLVIAPGREMRSADLETRETPVLDAPILSAPSLSAPLLSAPALDLALPAHAASGLSLKLRGSGWVVASLAVHVVLLTAAILWHPMAQDSVANVTIMDVDIVSAPDPAMDAAPEVPTTQKEQTNQEAPQAQPMDQIEPDRASSMVDAAPASLQAVPEEDHPASAPTEPDTSASHPVEMPATAAMADAQIIVPDRANAEPVSAVLPKPAPDKPQKSPLPARHPVRKPVRADPPVPRHHALRQQQPAVTPRGTATLDHAQAEQRRSQTTSQQVAQRASSGDLSAFRNAVMSRIQGAKRYPASAQARGAQGTAVVAFTVSGTGGLSGVALSQSSGDADLDREALATIQRAAPFPPTPDTRAARFTIPMRFHLR